jgi:hypothetical protein
MNRKLLTALSAAFALAASVMLASCMSLFRTAAPAAEPVQAQQVVIEVTDEFPPPRVNPAAKIAAGEVRVEVGTPVAPESDDLPDVYVALVNVKDQKIPIDLDVVITLTGDSFKEAIPEGREVTSWFRGLPTGLTGLLHGVKAGATSARIYVYGTPDRALRDNIQVVIPGSYLKSGADKSLASPEESTGTN